MTELVRVLIVANTAYMIRQFNMSNIELLQNMGYRVEIACNFIKGNPASKEVMDEFIRQLESLDVGCHQLPILKSPLKIRDNYKAFKTLLNLMRKNKYAFVHCQTPVGGVLARLAAFKTKTLSVYMAHGFHFYNGASLLTWLLYYPIEKSLSLITDVLIVINQEDYQLAKKRMKAKRLYYVPGVGIDVDALRIHGNNSLLTRGDIGVPEDTVLILSVGELNKNKNHETVIKALAQLPDVHYVIVGEGALKEHLVREAQKYSVAERVHLLGFRKDAQEIYFLADIYCHPSFREGLSVAVMEAMAAGLPIVCSEIRGNRDLIKQEIGGILLPNPSVESYVKSLREVISNKYIRESMGAYNAKCVEEYDKMSINLNMKDIYLNIQDCL